MQHNWPRSYCGIPFRARGRDRAGVDCYGLVCLVYREQFGIELPSYSGNYLTSVDAVIPALIVGGVQECCWRHLSDEEESRMGDVIVFRIKGAPRHVGIALDNYNMLHIESGTDVIRERWRSPIWSPRVDARVRHREMENGANRADGSQ